jgi:hypothetical protein
MIHKTTDKVWNDHRGNEVPVEYVPDIDRRTEVVIGKLLRSAESLSKKLAEFKMYAEMLKNANIEVGERKGNYTLTSFDKSVKIEINVSDRIEFDDNINFAQEKINEFLAIKTNGADFELTEIVNNAFKTRKGRLDSKRIMGLFSYKIKHKTWLEAMELLKNSITTNSSVRYMDFSVKDENGKYQPVKLNFSSI